MFNILLVLDGVVIEVANLQTNYFFNIQLCARMAFNAVADVFAVIFGSLLFLFLIGIDGVGLGLSD